MQLQHELVIRLVDEDFYTNIPCFLEHTSFLRLEKCVACALYFIDFRSKHTYKPCASKKKKKKNDCYIIFNILTHCQIVQCKIWNFKLGIPVSLMPCLKLISSRGTRESHFYFLVDLVVSFCWLFLVLISFAFVGSFLIYRTFCDQFSWYSQVPNCRGLYKAGG